MFQLSMTFKSSISSSISFVKLNLTPRPQMSFAIVGSSLRHSKYPNCHGIMSASVNF